MPKGIQGFQKGHKIGIGNHNTLGKHWRVSDMGRKNMSDASKGKPKSEIHKQNLKIARIGKKPALGKHWKIKDTSKLKGKFGEKANAWQGGLTPENLKIRHGIESHLWRESVFARDNWSCQKCGIKGGELHPHHIQNFAQYPELRFAINNGITFCRDCHREFHKKYGIKNNTKEQLTDFLS